MLRFIHLNIGKVVAKLGKWNLTIPTGDADCQNQWSNAVTPRVYCCFVHVLRAQFSFSSWVRNLLFEIHFKKLFPLNENLNILTFAMAEKVSKNISLLPFKQKKIYGENIYFISSKIFLYSCLLMCSSYQWLWYIWIAKH